VRSVHRALDDLLGGSEESWGMIGYASYQLWYRKVFRNESEEETVHCMSTHLFSSISDPTLLSDQHILQDQVALLYERIFTSPLPPPSRPFDWYYVILLLKPGLNSSLLSRQILCDVVSQHHPTWIRTHRSASLLYNIGYGVCHRGYVSREHAIELFTRLDKIMVDFCRGKSECVEELNEESVERWRELRTGFIRETHGQLSAEHFDNLPHQENPPLVICRY